MAIDNLEHLISTGTLDESEEEADRWVTYRLAKRVIDTTHEESIMWLCPFQDPPPNGSEIKRNCKFNNIFFHHLHNI